MDIHITIWRKKYLTFIGGWLRGKMLFCLSILMIFMLSACENNRTSTDALVDQIVPFAISGNHWNEQSLIEEDAYGRKLYRYLSQGDGVVNVFSDFVTVGTHDPVLVYVISQKEESGLVYCYESSCYIYVSSFESTSEIQLEKFRQENDWNKPLAEEKLTAYSANSYRERLHDARIPSTTDRAMGALNVFLGRTIDKYYIDAIMTPQGQPIFVVREVLVWVTENAENTENIFGSSYVFTITDSFEVEACNELIGSVDTWPDQLFSFKEQWNKSNGTRDGFVDSSEE